MRGKKFNLRADFNKTSSARKPVHPPPEGKDGINNVSKDGSKSKRDQTVVDAIPTDQSSTISNLKEYNIAPNAIESYQSPKPIRKSQSNGIVILDVLWANNMKGEEIYVGEDEMGDTKEEDNSESQPNMPEVSHDMQSERSLAKRAPISENLHNSSAIYRRCQTVAKRFKRFKLSTESRRRKRRQEARDPTNLPRRMSFCVARFYLLISMKICFGLSPYLGTIYTQVLST